MNEAVIIGKAILYLFVLFCIGMISYLCFIFYKVLRQNFSAFFEKGKKPEEKKESKTEDKKKGSFFCKHCGKSIEKGNKFCPICGGELG